MVRFEFDNYTAAVQFLTVASFGYGATECTVLVNRGYWIVVGAELPEGMTRQLEHELSSRGGVVFTGKLDGETSIAA